MSVDARQKELWLRELELNGFVVLRDFLPADLVREMHQQLGPILDLEHKRASDDEFKKARGRERIAFDLTPYLGYEKAPLADARFRHNETIEELLDAIFGEGKWKPHWTVAEVAFKGSAHMGWHSDQVPDETPDLNAPHETLRVTYNIPLVDFTWGNGATEFIPGSHRLPRAWSMEVRLVDIPHVYSVPLHLRVGDAVIRDGNCLHRGTPNLSDRPRPMLDQTYRRVSS